MLWNLLIIACFFAAVGSAWDAVAGVQMTLRGHILIAVTGVVIGGACAFAMWWVSESVGTRVSKLQSEPQRKWLLRAIFASSIFWIFLAAVLGRWICLSVLRLTWNHVGAAKTANHHCNP
jgi:hypothetical protein